MALVMTGEQIKNLVEYAGFAINFDTDESEKEFMYELEYTLHENLSLKDEETGEKVLEKLCVQCDGCQANEFSPL